MRGAAEPAVAQSLKYVPKAAEIAHEAGTLRNLCCLLGFHLWAQPDYSAHAARRSIRFCCWCDSVEIDGVRYS